MPAKKAERRWGRALRPPARRLHKGSRRACRAAAEGGAARRGRRRQGTAQADGGGGALNQLARRQPKDVERLLAAGKRLRKAHEALLSGWRTAPRCRRPRPRSVRWSTGSPAMRPRSRPRPAARVSANLDERIRNTLHAAALDEQTAAELAAGRLLREREAVGMFGAATSGACRTPARRGRRTSVAVKGFRRNAERRERRCGARAEQQKAQREHASAVKATERAGKRADEAQRRADEARTASGKRERREKDAARAPTARPEQSRQPRRSSGRTC